MMQLYEVTGIQRGRMNVGDRDEHLVICRPDMIPNHEHHEQISC